MTTRDGKIVIGNTSPANYGQTTNYGQYGTGSIGARNEAWHQGEFNDSAEGKIAGATNVANGMAQGEGHTIGTQDAGAANNAASGANGNQAGAIELARRMAMGSQPSQGAMQMQQGLNQASAQQSSMAAGARGSAAMATAGANRAANVSNLQQNAYSGAGMLRSQEMAQGRGMYSSLVNDKRGQDAETLGEADRVGMANAKSYDDYRLGAGNAAVGLGGVANGQNGNDLDNYNRGMAPVFAQDDMNQQGKEWDYENQIHRATDNKDNL